jgi:hypothetical protein
MEDAEYRLEQEARPFCVFLAHVAPNTPIKMLRLKLLLFLQASPFLDLGQAADRLRGVGALKPELAVILGRVSPLEVCVLGFAPPIPLS